MTNETVLFVVLTVGLILAAAIIFVVIMLLRRRHFRRKKLKTAYFSRKWQETQGMLRDNKMWALAVIDADKLLDEALKARRFKGKTMGERLVSAQREITNNDLVWFGHKLRNKLVHDPAVKLRKNDVKDAMLGAKSALKDLGAFSHDK